MQRGSTLPVEKARKQTLQLVNVFVRTNPLKIANFSTSTWQILRDVFRHYNKRHVAVILECSRKRRVDVVKIKELMGQASIVTTMRYIHATDQGKRGAIVVLSEYGEKHRKQDGTTWSQRKKGGLFNL